MSRAGSQGEGGPGERNYPSHATAAFEMVLSPGAGRASAAWVQLPPSPLGHHSGRDSQRRHAGTQAKAGTGRERRLPPIIIRSRKVLGGVGDSFKSPPAHPRISVSLSPRQARRRRARMQKPAVRQAAGRRTATATPQRAEEGRERDREEPSMQTGVTEENSEVKVSLI